MVVSSFKVFVQSLSPSRLGVTKIQFTIRYHKPNVFFKGPTMQDSFRSAYQNSATESDSLLSPLT